MCTWLLSQINKTFLNQDLRINWPVVRKKNQMCKEVCLRISWIHNQSIHEMKKKNLQQSFTFLLSFCKQNWHQSVRQLLNDSYNAVLCTQTAHTCIQNKQIVLEVRSFSQMTCCLWHTGKNILFKYHFVFLTALISLSEFDEYTFKLIKVT